MDRQTRNLLLIAVAVIFIAYLVSRGSVSLPFLRSQEADIDVDPIVVEPVVLPTIDPNIVIDPSINADVDAEVEVTTVNPGPLISLDSPAGFPSGVLHGIISPFMLVSSLFMPAVRMYATNNAGPLYDFGFMLGILILLALTQVRRFRRG
jgi:hypothetical protein